MKKTFVLASGSPRRKELLKAIGLDFKVDPPLEYAEIHTGNRSAHEVVVLNAMGKAESVAENWENAIIVGVDTVGAYEDRILEKPKDFDDAFEMLQILQGNKHEVLTGICIIDTATGKKITAVESTVVEFVPMSQDEIKKYIKTGEPMDKAAAYAAQGIGSLFVKSLHGDYFNVVGLPMYRLNLMLKEFDFDLIDVVN